jgi:hypothetical protein
LAELIASFAGLVLVLFFVLGLGVGGVFFFLSFGLTSWWVVVRRWGFFLVFFSFGLTSGWSSGVGRWAFVFSLDS